MTCLCVILGAIAVILVLKILIVGAIFKDEINAIFDRDPAAKSSLEVILTYSGLHAVIYYRLTHVLWKWKVPLLPRMLSQYAKFVTGIEIHPAAQIGKGLFIDHGMGVVIGETAIIGDDVTLFQGVTLGGTGKEKGKRHPTLGSNIVVGAGAKILGNINIGDNSYVGANAVVIKDVPPNSTVVGVPGRVTRQDGKKIDVKLDHIHVLDPIMQNLEELQDRIDKLENK